jgi:hypothetical protein
MSQQPSLRTRRDIEAFFDEMGERPVRLALENRLRFPMPFGEYHAAMWLARRGREKREMARQREAVQLSRTLDAASASAEILERGARFAAGAALVAIIALAFNGLKGG